MKQKITPILFFVILLVSIVLVSAGIRPSAAAPTGDICPPECVAMLPFLAKPLNLDFTVTDVEVFQAVQTDNNSVPLITGKTAVARIYAQLLVGTSPNNVQVSLTAVRNGNTLGTVNATGPVTVPSAPAHGNYNTTYNVILPGSWLSGQVQLIAKVDAADAYSELNESNNQFSRTVTFNNVPNLQVVIVPINYTHQGSSFPGFYPAQSTDYLSDWVKRVYPVANVTVTVRAPYNFSGNLQGFNSWEVLLDQMYSVKLGDGHPEYSPIVYYAYVPVTNASNRWFFGGIAGVGWISPPGMNYRESVGLNLQPINPGDATGVLAGHEIGHNMGRYHAPCGGPAGPDPTYPYPGASIGHFATDIKGSSVSFYTPASHVDMMSYCSPEWISDYTYIAIYNNQRVQGVLETSPQTAERLIIRGQFNDTGLALLPTYAFAMPAGSQTAVSTVQAELLDANGAVIASYPIAVREAEEEGIYVRAALGNVPLPSVPVASLRLVENGAVLAERQLLTAQRWPEVALSLSQTADALSLSWNAPDAPAMIRYTTDDGASWTTLALDVVGGTFTMPIADLWADGRFEVILADSGPAAALTAEFQLSE